jgi:hypothetical protein
MLLAMPGETLILRKNVDCMLENRVLRKIFGESLENTA